MIFAALAILACNTYNPEVKMKEIVKLYLDSTLKDPRSYEPINFTIDTLREFEGPEKGKVFGYLVTHSFRAKNGFGALDINDMEFRIDTAIKEVVFAQKARYHANKIINKNN